MPVLQDIYTWAASQTRLKDSMFFEEGKAWGRSRRLISPNLNGHNVPAMLPIMAKVSRLATAVCEIHVTCVARAMDVFLSFFAALLIGWRYSEACQCPAFFST